MVGTAIHRAAHLYLLRDCEYRYWVVADAGDWVLLLLWVLLPGVQGK